jgi:hypothetical protein
MSFSWKLLGWAIVAGFGFCMGVDAYKGAFLMVGDLMRVARHATGIGI